MDETERTTNTDWAIVLAAGRGKRLEGLTRALYGCELPKQFAALDGDRTFLQHTMVRAGRLVPPERTVVVAAEEYGMMARAQLAPFPGVHVVEQPRDVGTLPGLLLPLAHVLAAEPRARLIVYPSDHHVFRISAFDAALTSALAAVDRAPSRTVLVGARADRPATDLGWIRRGHALDGVGVARTVECFVEKPPVAAATRLYAQGALWNTLIIAMDGAAFWDGALATHRALAPFFERYLASIGGDSEQTVRREIYGDLPTLDLSRDLLARRAGLAVVEMADAGWSDCGTPERLFECLEVTGELEGLRRRLGAASTARFESGF